MTTYNDFARRLVAAFCTVVVRATLVAGAVGPAAVSQAAPITRASA